MATVPRSLGLAARLRRFPIFCRIKTVHIKPQPALCRYSDYSDDKSYMGPPIPPYQKRQGEASDVKKARLLYQSRYTVVTVIPFYTPVDDIF